MNYLVQVFAVVALLCNTSSAANVNRQMKLLEKMDRKNSNSNVIRHSTMQRRFVSLTKPPKPEYVLSSVPLEITCEAIGAPAPSIRWFKNDRPVYEFDQESTESIDSNPSSLARISSTLLISRTERDRDEYTCVIMAGQKTARATTAVIRGEKSFDLTDRARLLPLKPKIVVAYKVYVDTIGTNVVLPCRAKGHPRPWVTWIGSKGENVEFDPRFKVLKSGELIINGLSWSDMGEYTCTASNGRGSATAKTFLYPAKDG